MASHAGQQHDQRHLPHVGRFTAHVRAGDQQHAARRIQPATVGGEAFNGVFHHGVAAGVDIDVGVFGKIRRDPVVAARVFAQRGQRVQLGQRGGAVRQGTHVFGQYVQ
ncbi:hypothetical protein D3C72_1862620 [compost metagenome]